MSNENANQPAYPFKKEGKDYMHEGLTKRELIAAMAMQGILANEKLRWALLSDRNIDMTTSDNCVAIFATKQADELLNQLSKP